MFTEAVDAALKLSPYISPIAFLFICFVIYLWRDERKERKELQQDFKELDHDVIQFMGDATKSLTSLKEEVRNAILKSIQAK